MSDRGMWLRCQNCGVAFHSPKRFYPLCFVCGGEQPGTPVWMYVVLVVMIAVNLAWRFL